MNQIDPMKREQAKFILVYFCHKNWDFGGDNALDTSLRKSKTTHVV